VPHLACVPTVFDGMAHTRQALAHNDAGSSCKCAARRVLVFRDTSPCHSVQVYEYALSQMTLHDVYYQLSRNQEEETARV
jgi:hypothetical protein